MNRVGVMDYGVGNLRSVANALRYVGSDPVVSDHSETLLACDRIIFPGVGAFAYGREALYARGLHQVVLKAFAAGTPLLGICVGMQLLFDRSFEFGDHEGLGLIPGTVRKFNADLRLPNVNWLPIQPVGRADDPAAKLLEDVTPRSRFYFVHSYYAESNNPHTVATSHFGGQPFAAAVSKGSIVATQFHPEKSGPDGLNILRKFAS